MMRIHKKCEWIIASSALIHFEIHVTSLGYNDWLWPPASATAAAVAMVTWRHRHHRTFAGYIVMRVCLQSSLIHCASLLCRATFNDTTEQRVKDASLHEKNCRLHLVLIWTSACIICLPPLSFHSPSRLHPFHLSSPLYSPNNYTTMQTTVGNVKENKKLWNLKRF